MYKHPDLAKRQSQSTDARRKLVERFRSKPVPKSPDATPDADSQAATS